MTRGEKERLNKEYGAVGGKEAQEGRSAQAWEKGLEAVSQARNAAIKALIAIEAIKEAAEAGTIQNGDLENIAVNVAETLCNQSISLGEAFDLFRESFKVLEEEGDTIPPQAKESFCEGLAAGADPGMVIAPSLVSEALRRFEGGRTESTGPEDFGGTDEQSHYCSTKAL